MSFSTSTSTPPRPNATSLPKTPIGDRADDDFLAAREHLLDLDAFDLGFGLYFLAFARMVRVSLCDVGGGLDTNHHAAGFGLVQDIRRDDLHTTGKPIRRASSRPRRPTAPSLHPETDAVGFA